MMKLAPARFALLTGVLVSACVIQGPIALHAQESRPTFSAGIALVPITAVVRDSRNRIVRDLTREDFQVLEHGLPRPIVEFMARDDGPISVAFLFDTSGSMPVASNLEKGKGLVAHFLTQMKPSSDEAALFTFDKDLRQEVPFTNDVNNVRGALGRVTAWGLTSLYDAIAETAKRVADRGPSGRRAVVVITDGDDTSSVLTPAEVSGLASAIDVPVYVVAVVSPLDHPGNAGAVVAAETNGNLSNLAYWTGGDLLYVSAPEQTSLVTKELLAVMRQRSFLAIESSTAPGWYRLEVRMKRRDLTVRTRSGYFAAQSPRIGEAAPAGRKGQS